MGTSSGLFFVSASFIFSDAHFRLLFVENNKRSSNEEENSRSLSYKGPKNTLFATSIFVFEDIYTFETVVELKSDIVGIQVEFVTG